MKILLNSLFALCTIGLVVSCVPEENMQTDTDGTIEMLIDDVEWKANEAYADIGFGVISLSGIGSPGETLVIRVEGQVEGEYSLVDPNASSLVFVDATGNYATGVGTQNSGSVIITDFNTVDSLITGTFEANVSSSTFADPRVITEGKFTKIPVTLTTIPATENEMFAKVDNVDFTPTNVQIIQSGGNINVAGSIIRDIQ